ncbi:MAG: AbrB/MazE/SpoVT family DNA-binding domain-containing protein [Christensenellales bacterium]|jgi:transcriptional pleiotropic regulator of transition state genes
MRSTGIVRKVDELGRIVIPKEIRNQLGIELRDALEIFVDDECVVLKKYAPGCIFCGQVRDVKVYRGKLICQQCAQNMLAQFEE